MELSHSKHAMINFAGTIPKLLLSIHFYIKISYVPTIEKVSIAS